VVTQQQVVSALKFVLVTISKPVPVSLNLEMAVFWVDAPHGLVGF
jgi:hypothetical protein